MIAIAAKRTLQGLVLVGALCAVGAWTLQSASVQGAQQKAGPAHAASAVSGGGTSSPATAEALLPTQATTVHAPVAKKDRRQYAALMQQFPAGLQTEGQLALRAGDARRALEVASELAACQYFQELRLDFEKRGRQDQLAKLLPGADRAEQARVDAFCQTGGPAAEALKVQLALFSAHRGVPDAVYWVYEEQWDPSGEAGRQIGRWALSGQDLLAMGKVLLAARPETLGLNSDDLNVVRKASAVVLEQPEFASRLGFKGILQTAQESASKQLAGASGLQAQAQLAVGKPPIVKFAELRLSSADERRAQAIVDALVSERRRQLAEAGR